MLKSVNIEAVDEHQYSLVALHGLGADGHDLAGLADEMSYPKANHTRWILPHAPMRPVTINGGMKMRAWYDIKDISIERKLDYDAVRESTEQVMALITTEMERGIPSQRIILLGFSQGGLIAAHAAMKLTQTLQAVIILSSYYPPELHRKTVQRAPVFIGHGMYDPVVPIDLSSNLRSYLEQQGIPFEFHQYPIQHGISLDEISAISDFIQRTDQSI